MYPDGPVFVIEPAAGSPHGIVIGGVKSQRSARLQSDRFALSIGDRALDLDGYRYLRASDAEEPDLSFLEDGRPPGLEPPLLTGYSNRGCAIDAVSFFRTNNWPLHEYYLVYRMLKIGSAASAALRLRGKSVEETHAVILFEGGESFLLAVEGSVAVSRGPGESKGAAGALPDGPPDASKDASRRASADRSTGASSEGTFELRPRTLLPLLPGMEIVIADNHLFVEAATDSHFKST
jgi:hypothetical protein